MRGVIALSISILILTSSLVTATGNGGINEVTNLENTGIVEVNFSEVFYGNQEFIINIQLEEDSNVSSVQVSTQICVNSGLCYPPEPQDLVKDNSTEIWTAAVSTIDEQTYVNWNFVLNDGDNETRIPETGWGWKVWSDCWFDGEEWGGEAYDEGSTNCGQEPPLGENEQRLPSLSGAAILSVLIMAAIIRRD
jgi:hypothetical protein